MLRGGSWINNPDNAQCAIRNNNEPHNRNNNVGFRLSCESHAVPVLQMPTGRAHYGRRGGAGRRHNGAGASGLCRGFLAARQIASAAPAGWAIGLLPGAAFCAFTLEPAAEQAPSFSDHSAHMAELPII